MPCSDGGYDMAQLEKRKKERERLDRERKLTVAVLCGICTALEHPGKAGTRTSLPFILDQIDWKEVGFTRTEFVVWWDNHEREDRERREREHKRFEAARKKNALVRSALDKLTPDEKKALGL